MQTNGTISPAFISTTENEHGEISSSVENWGTDIRCAIVVNNDTRLGKYEDGEFRMSAYTVLISVDTPYYSAIATEEDSTVVTTDWDAVVIQTKQFNYERVRLTRYDEDLGEFRVQKAEVFPRMGRITIQVAQ